MKQVILGTAGHIDHGKTSLIKALTGIDTDRLKEEKERGITIELGFAHLALPGGQLLGIVDVPGHERFVKNMVAGATGIDLVALIIAADEGVMPQTREHLEICQLLHIKHGVVVLTKIDLVDSEWRELVKEDIAEFLAETFLEEAPIVEVSSATREGLETLVQTLDRIVTEIPEREMGHIFRLPIDRVFTMKGFGTVVTGTTISGQIHLGDEATIYPQGLAAKIRGMQVHNREVDHVRVGLRTAINLQGVEKAEIDRGHILTGKDSLRPTQRLDVLVELLPSVPKKLKNRARVRFHTGTSEIISTIVLLDRDELIPGESCFAQIRLDDPTAVLLHDRYVLRSYSPVRTIGGGEILSPLPGKRKRFSGEALTELKVLSTGSLSDIAAQFVHSGRFQGVELGELLFLTCAGKKELNDVLKALQAQKKIIQYDKERQVFIHAHLMERAREEIMTTLSHFHRDFPLKEGLSKEEVRSRTAGSNNPKLFHFIINQLIQEDLIAQEKDLLRLKEHRVTLGQDQEDIRRELGEIYLYQGLQPPYFRDIKDKFPGKAGSDVLEVMVKDGVLIKVKEDLYFHGGAIDELRNRLIQFLKEKGEISTTQFKDLTGVSRKYAIPLVEYFDKCQLTVRVGDNRVLRKK